MAKEFGGPKSAQQLQTEADLAEALAVLQTLARGVERKDKDLMKVGQAEACAVLEKHSLVV